jgi:peptidyl-prolyl cis-trans isomerase C
MIDARMFPPGEDARLRCPLAPRDGKGNREMATGTAMGTRLRALLSEPLLQFALLGLALFVVNRLWGAKDIADNMRIVVDAPLVAHQSQLYAVQFGAAPDALTLESLLQRYTREEALYREGMRLHLDAGDEVIRQRVVQKMETLLADAEIIPEPAAAQLREFHAHNAARYTEAGEVSFRQIYFALEGGQAARAESRARAALSRLKIQPDARIDSDALAIGESFTGLDSAEVARRFGNSTFARAVNEAPAGNWSGPYASGFGMHLLRVESRSAPRVQPLEQVRSRVREDFLAAARESARERRIAGILARYSVVKVDAR